jgi:hypothetical protein
MSHMPTIANDIGVPVSGGLVVIYEATGAEGTNFLVPIGQTLDTAEYEIVWSPKGVQNIPFLDLPDGPGDRTTTYFRVKTVAELAAGEKLTFVLFGV